MDKENMKECNKINEHLAPNNQVHYYEHGDDNQKRKELVSIQNDLNDLMFRLSNFIADSQDFYDSDQINENFIDDAQEYCGGNCENKKDIGNEKHGYVFVDDYYINDGINLPEINWNILAPYIQSIVSDLQKLRNLNIMTNNVMSRIRKVTEDIAIPIANEAELLLEQGDKDIDEKEEDENETRTYDNDVEIE